MVWHRIDIGTDGEEYNWSRVYASEYRDGLAVSVREFAVEEEDAAFAYAESLVSPKTAALVVDNAASRAIDRAIAGMRAGDADAVNSLFSPQILYEDRRPFAGALTTGIEYDARPFSRCSHSSTTSRAIRWPCA